MKQIRLTLFVLWMLLLPGILRAQKCFSNELEKQLHDTDPARYAILMQVREQLNGMSPRLSDSLYTIPVVVHIVYNTEAQNLPDERVFTQINVLNEDFRRMNADTTNTPDAFRDVAADCMIEFCLASFDPYGDSTSGITRTHTDTTEWKINFSEKVKHNSTGGEDAWPCVSYLNIWVCNLDDGILGYAVSPGSDCTIDGIVVDYKNFGLADVTSQPYHLGRTCTHEIGHWLGLTHVWGDDGGTCLGDDGISDTPLQAGENYGCPDFPLTDACTLTFPGVMFQNYMDYTDDACMNIFTQDQKARMRTVLETYRASILTSAAGCNAIEPLPGDLAEILVYPNPTNGQFTLSIKNFVGYNDHFDISIYDAMGQLITTEHPEAANNTAQYFDLSWLATGCYFVQIFNGTYFLSKEFLKY